MAGRMEGRKPAARRRREAPESSWHGWKNGGAQARSEKEARSAGVELAWLEEWKGASPQREGGGRAQARSEKKARSAGIELAWLEERKD